VASGSTPVSNLPYPTGNDGFGVAQDMQALATAIDTRLVMPFANETERAGKVGQPQDGAWCYLRDRGTYETYSAKVGGWTWPKWAYGELARAEYVETRDTPPSPGRTPLDNSLVGLPAWNVTVPVIPAGRRIRISFGGSMSTDQRETGYQFFLIFAGIQRRVTVPMIAADIPHSFQFSYTITTPGRYVNQTGGVLQGSRLFGPGNCYLNTTSYDGPTQFLVEDLGGV
jgi:hypothetical protein